MDPEPTTEPGTAAEGPAVVAEQTAADEHEPDRAMARDIAVAKLAAIKAHLLAADNLAAVKAAAVWLVELIESMVGD